MRSIDTNLRLSPLMLLLFLTVTQILAAPQPIPRGVPSKTLDTRAVDPLPVFNIAHPAPTPAFVAPPIPSLLPVEKVAGLLATTTAGPLTVLGVAATALEASIAAGSITGVTSTLGSLVPNVLCSLLGCVPAQAVTVPSSTATNATTLAGGVLTMPTCLNSSYNDTTINSLFYYGGAGLTVYLCENAVINLQNPIVFTAANQVLTTLNSPLGSTRAILRVMGSQQSCGVYGTCAGCDGVTLQNVQVDGNRPGLGYLSTGLALIEMGGNTAGQKVTNTKAYEPRGWTCLHMIEGYANSCTGSIVTNNQIGPSGHAPSGAAQFKKRDNTGAYPPGEWADGLSIACKGSTVTGNTITDATDGGIVIFGAPGTIVSNNIITANNRQLLGGINSVDFYPFLGDFTGTIVKNNQLISQASMIKIGIAVGVLSWQTYNVSAARTFNGQWSSNVLSSGPTGYFGYGITASGHNASTITGNIFTGANFGGVATSACDTVPLPAFGPLYQNPYTTPLSTFQTSFKPAVFDFMICSGPGNITSTATLQAKRDYGLSHSAA